MGSGSAGLRRVTLRLLNCRKEMTGMEPYRRIYKLDLHATGARIKALRREKGVPMDVLLDACGLTSSRTYYGWTSGTLKPSVCALFSLSRLFDVRVDDILVFQEVETDDIKSR